MTLESTFPRLLLPRCYRNVGSVMLVPSGPTIRLSDKDFQFVKDDIKWVKYSLLLVTMAPPILMLKKFKADVDKKNCKFIYFNNGFH